MYSDFIKDLGERLQAENDTPAYLLVDPTSQVTFSQQILAEFGCERIPLPLRHESISDSQRPFLVPLERMHLPLLEISVAKAHQEQSDPQAEAALGFAISGWLLSDLSPEYLASHLARNMDQVSPGQVEKRLFRWVDRRVLEWMWPVLDGAQRSELFGPMKCWYSINRCADLVEYQALGGRGRIIQLSSWQWEHAGLCQVAQDLLRGWHAFSATLPPDYAKRAEGAVKAVKELGISSRSDTVLLASYILQVHPRLASHPELIRLLAEGRRDGLGLLQVLNAIPDPEGWDRMKQDLLLTNLASEKY